MAFEDSTSAAQFAKLVSHLVAVASSTYCQETVPVGGKTEPCNFKMKRYSFIRELAGPPPMTCMPGVLRATKPPSASAANTDNNGVALEHDDAEKDPFADAERMEMFDLDDLTSSDDELLTILNPGSMRDMDFRAAYCSTNLAVHGAMLPSCTLLSGGASAACASR